MASVNKENSTVISDPSAEPRSEAFRHLAQGKRHLLVGDYDEAVRSFADACALMVNLYGETANECGEVYLNYGTALLELARTENGVLGMEADGGEKEDSEDEDEEKPAEGGKEPAENGKGSKLESETNVENSEVETCTNEDEEKPAEGGKEPVENSEDSKQESERNVGISEVETCTNEDEEKPAEGVKEPVENGEDSKQESETDVQNSEVETCTNEDEEKPAEGGKEPVENGEDSKQDSETNVENSEVEGCTPKDQESGEKIEGVDDEDVSNLRLAWEVLELAKIIFQRQSEGKHMELKLAEVYLKLGEVGLESETYSQAIEDIKACLEIRKRVLEEHDRCIAETYYQLGMAYSLINEFEDAVTNFTLAHTLLEKRIQLLQEKIKQGEKAEQSEANPFYTLQGEISELNNLLPEVKEKISDIQDFKKETKKALYARIGYGDDQSSSSAPSTSAAFPDAKLDSKPATDISHLVRKKRKPESDSSEEKCPKQPCLDGAKAE